MVLRGTGGSIFEVLDWELARGNRVEGTPRAHEPGPPQLPLPVLLFQNGFQTCFTSPFSGCCNGKSCQERSAPAGQDITKNTKNT